MVDPFNIFEILKTIADLANKFSELLRTIKDNQKGRDRLLEHIGCVSAIVKFLQQKLEGKTNIVKSDGHQMMSDELEGLEKTLKRGLEDIEACRQKKHLVGFYKASDIAKKLREIDQDIWRNMMLAMFATMACIFSEMDKMGADVKKVVNAVRAGDAASISSELPILSKRIAKALPDLPPQVTEQVHIYSTSITNQNNDKREPNKTMLVGIEENVAALRADIASDRLEVKVGILADSNAPRASSDGKAMSTSVESVIGQDVKKTSSSVSNLVDKAHSVVVFPAPSQLQQVIGVSEVPGEAGSYKVGSLSSETSKLFGAYAAGASFESNKETIRCPVTLTNKTDHYVGIWIKSINEQFARTSMIMERHSSLAVSVTTKTHESPEDTINFEVLMIAVESKHDLVELESSIGGKLTMDSGFMAQAKKLQAEMYRAMLTAIICEPARCPQIISGSAENMTSITSIDVHPTKTWIVTTHKRGTVYIWDYQQQKCVSMLQVTKEPNTLACVVHKCSQYFKETPATHWLCSAKFITREKWLAVGNGEGYIYVYDYDYADTKLYEVKKFRAYHGKSVDSLAVHPSKPYLLSSSAYNGRIKLWDWNRNWEKIQEFDVTTAGFFKGVRSLKFNPRDANTFACVTHANRAKVGNIKSSSLTATMEGPFEADYFFAPSDQQLMVTLSSPHECTCEIRDLETQKIVHTLGVNGRKTTLVACDPKLPIFATMLDDSTVCLWDASTCRLEKMVPIPDTDSSLHDMVFVTDTNDITRLVVAFESMIAIMEVNMPVERGTSLFAL